MGDVDFHESYILYIWGFIHATENKIYEAHELSEGFLLNHYNVGFISFPSLPIPSLPFSSLPFPSFPFPSSLRHKGPQLGV